MDVEKLREYIVLAHRLNFTSAAKALHVSQPTLSSHIKALESEAGTKLIERVPGDVARLTPAGQEFLSMAQSIMKNYEDTLAKIKDMKSTISGKIRIRSPRYEYSRPLLAYIQEFIEDNPNTDVVLSPWIAEDGYTDVISGKVDCAFVGQGLVSDGPIPDNPGIKLVTYADMEGFIWVDKNDALAKKDIVSITDLDKHCIVVSANQKNNSSILTLESMASEHGIEITFEEKYSESLEDLVMNKIDKNDLSIGFHHLRDMSVFDMRPDRIIKYFTPPLMFRMSLAYADNDDNPALTAFVQFLHEKYAASKLDQS